MEQTPQPNKIKIVQAIFLFVFITSHIFAQGNRQKINFNSDWQFKNQEQSLKNSD